MQLYKRSHYINQTKNVVHRKCKFCSTNSKMQLLMLSKLAFPCGRKFFSWKCLPRNPFESISQLGNQVNLFMVAVTLFSVTPWSHRYISSIQRNRLYTPSISLPVEFCMMIGKFLKLKTNGVFLIFLSSYKNFGIWFSSVTSCIIRSCAWICKVLYNFKIKSCASQVI